MPVATLQTVSPDHRTFETKFGQMAAFDVQFADGRSGQVVTKVETLEKRRADFEALIGKEAEFVIEDNGTWPDGARKPLKVKLPQMFGSGGQRGGSPARAPRDEEAIQERMDRRTALMQAVALAVAEQEGPWNQVADEMYDWLRKTAGGSVHGEGAGSPATTSTPVAGGTPAGEKPGTDRDTSIAQPLTSDGGGHIHQWHPSPNPQMAAKGWVVCDCGSSTTGAVLGA